VKNKKLTDSEKLLDYLKKQQISKAAFYAMLGLSRRGGAKWWTAGRLSASRRAKLYNVPGLQIGPEFFGEKAAADYETTMQLISRLYKIIDEQSRYIARLESELQRCKGL